MGSAAGAVVRRSPASRGVVGIVAIVLLSIVPTRRAYAHPLHTTLTQMTEDRARGVVRATIRVFADDFGTSVTRFARNPGAPMSAQWNAAAFGYVSSVFTIAGKSGAALPLRSCGVTRTADVLWICVEATSPPGLAATQVRNAMLCDQFEDQVNVVQSTFGGSRHSLLFTRGDRIKPLG